jgi:hypothetical protein
VDRCEREVTTGNKGEYILPDEIVNVQSQTKRPEERVSPQMAEEKPEKYLNPTLQVLRKAYGGCGGGLCLVADLRLLPHSSKY